MRLLNSFAILAFLTYTSSANPRQNFGGRIIGGKDAEDGEFPYQVSYRYGYQDLHHDIHICGGTILSKTWVLTAGHCATIIQTDYFEYNIMAGINNLDAQGQLINVVKKVVHPLYKGHAEPNDIALLQLETPLEFTQYVQPVKLPASKEFIALGAAVFSGWGANFSDADYNTDELQRLDVEILDNHKCLEDLDKLFGLDNVYTEASNICAGVPEKKGTCGSDSGGGLVQNNTVVGVASWGITPCGSRVPAIYTKVSNFLDFILEHVTDLPA